MVDLHSQKCPGKSDSMWAEKNEEFDSNNVRVTSELTTANKTERDFYLRSSELHELIIEYKHSYFCPERTKIYF